MVLHMCLPEQLSGLCVHRIDIGFHIGEVCRSLRGALPVWRGNVLARSQYYGRVNARNRPERPIYATRFGVQRIDKGVVTADKNAAGGKRWLAVGVNPIG